MSFLHTAVLLTAFAGGDPLDDQIHDNQQIHDRIDNPSIVIQNDDLEFAGNGWLAVRLDNTNDWPVDAEPPFRSPSSWNPNDSGGGANPDNDRDRWLANRGGGDRSNLAGGSNPENREAVSVDQDRANRDPVGNPDPTVGFDENLDRNPNAENNSIVSPAIEGANHNNANLELAAPLKRGNDLRDNPVEEHPGANPVRTSVHETQNSVVK